MFLSLLPPKLAANVVIWAYVSLDGKKEAVCLDLGESSVMNHGGPQIVQGGCILNGSYGVGDGAISAATGPPTNKKQQIWCGDIFGDTTDILCGGVDGIMNLNGLLFSDDDDGINHGKKTVVEANNLVYDKETEYLKADRDIQAGEELLCNYNEFHLQQHKLQWYRDSIQEYRKDM